MSTRRIGGGYQQFCGGLGRTVSDAAVFVAWQAWREGEARGGFTATEAVRPVADAGRLLDDQRNVGGRRGFLWLLVFPPLAARYEVLVRGTRIVRLLRLALFMVCFGVAAAVEAARGRWVELPVADLVCIVAGGLVYTLHESPTAP